jgi:hypothetical protein
MALGALLWAGCERAPPAQIPPEPPPPVFTTPAEEIAAAATPGDPAPPITLGRGVDGVSGALREVCLDGTVTTLQDPVAYITNSGASVEGLLDPDGWFPQVDPLLDAGPVGQFLRRSRLGSLSAVSTVPVFLLTTTSDQLATPWPPQLLVAPDAPDFLSRCGDEVVQQRGRGAQLFLLVRRDWLDQAAFGAWWELARSGAVGTNALTVLDPPEALIPLAGRMAIHVEVLQRGGDPERLSRRLRPAGSAEVAWSWSRDCGAGDVRPCRDFIQQVVSYAFDAGLEGFTGAVGERPADLTRTLRGWDMFGGPRARYPIDAITAARFQLSGARATQVAIAERYRLLSGRLLDVPAVVAARLPGVAARLAANLAALAAASRACLDELVDPADAAQVARCVDGATPAGLAAAGYDDTLSLAELTPGP